MKDLEPEKTLEQTPEEETQDLTSTLADTLERLENTDEATVVSPISDTVIALPNRQGMTSIPSERNLVPDTSLAEKLKEMFRNSKKLYEMPIRGAVFRCGDKTVAKVVRMSHPDTTGYTSLEYLPQHAPDFPAPRPYGLVTLGRSSV